MKSKFTQKAQNTLGRALDCAREMGHSYIGSEHLLLGLLGEDDSAASRLLYARGADFDRVRTAVAEIAGIGNESNVLPSDMTPRTRKIIENSSDIAAKYTQSFIGTEHILLALCEERDCVAARLLESISISPAEIRSDITSYLDSISGHSSSQKSKEGKKEAIDGAPTLSKFGHNLTAAAATGKLDSIIGRESETERIIQILCRRQKNNPCLIGEPGVGKTAIIEGIAKLISDRDVPEPLQDKIIFTLDLPSMIAGAKYRGEFEDRMKNVMDEASKNRSIILFIDEIHTIIGAGAAEGAVDAANIIKPALARGELQVIGATTIGEYRKHIEKDPALERRFQPVNIGEPSPEEAIKILNGIRSVYEEHHGLKISDEAISAAVELSVRYINGRFLPDKAVDLIDEAAAGKRIKLSNLPGTSRGYEKQLREVQREKESAIGNQNFELAADLRDKEKEIRALYSKVLSEKNTDDSSSILKSADIAETVTRWTGIPVRNITENEAVRLRELEKRLAEHVVGQNEAIKALSAAIRRGRLGVSDHKRPIGSFIFSGPSGVGKTELCRVLAYELFGSQNFLVRFDMSEYMEKHSVSRLIGAPPGYVGYDEGGQLTERVRSMPYCVLLFDEIEKAHRDIFNLLLQILEDGILTDSQGRRVSFLNTVVILTSNIGAQYQAKRLGIGFSDSSAYDLKRDEKKRIIRALEEAFRPEFLNRIDDIIVFEPLNNADMKKICKIMLADLQARCREGVDGFSIDFTDNAVDFLCVKGFDPMLGARPMRRVIQKEVEEVIADSLLEGNIHPGDNLTVSLSSDGNSLRIIEKPVVFE